MSHRENEDEITIPKSLTPEIVNMLGELAGLPDTYQNTVINSIDEDSKSEIAAENLSQQSDIFQISYNNSPIPVSGQVITEYGKEVICQAATAILLETFHFNDDSAS